MEENGRLRGMIVCNFQNTPNVVQEQTLAELDTPLRFLLFFFFIFVLVRYLILQKMTMHRGAWAHRCPKSHI